MFKHAIVRKPCKALIDGISTAQFVESSERPVYEKAIQQHEKYIETLEELGAEVLVLPADENFPDSVFTEDPAVVMEGCAVITNPARDSRNGEKETILPAIQKYYSDDQIFHINAPGTMEGGDVMQVGRHFYVGLSDRTNAEGARQFDEIVSKFGYTTETVSVTEGLHLKDFAVYLDKKDILVTELMDQCPAFKDFDRHVIPPEELYAINSMYFNGIVIVPEGYPKTLKIIEDLGYSVKVLNNDEMKKIDGSLTCQSLRF